MCGICGIYLADGDRADPLILKAMTSALRHRGPDDEGFFLEANVGLGHRRLSILDLATGRQPLFSEDRRLAFVLNGEIYNYAELRRGLIARGHAFSTASDSEVVLHLYEEKGEDCLADLRGMFAFALWDAGRRELFFARDRLGKKPFYYYWDEQQFVFGSEIKSLLKAGLQLRIDPDALMDFFQYQYIPSPRSIYREIRKLPPGHYGIVGPAGLTLKRYWDVPVDPSRWEGRSPASVEEDIGSEVRECVRMRLASDVPLGAFLSGGLDSSLIVALMKGEAGGRVKTFSIGFPEASYDESAWAAKVAETLGTDHRARQVDYRLEDSLRPLLLQFDEPFGDSSALPTFHLSRFAKEGVTVALSGDGGDELFGGYRRYLAARWGRRYLKVPAFLREGLIAPAVAALPARPGYYGRRPSKKAKIFLEAASRIRAGKPPLPCVFAPEEIAALFRDDLFGLGGRRYEDILDEEWRKTPPGLDDQTRLMWFDLHHYLPDDILVKVDRMSMAHALEVRCPYLDHVLVERVFNLPLSFKIHGGETKYLLKRIARRYLPPDVVHRKKQGFMVPLETWFRKELRSLWEDEVLGSSLYDPEAVGRIWREHASGRFDHAAKLWLLLVFALFKRTI